MLSIQHILHSLYTYDIDNAIEIFKKDLIESYHVTLL